MAVLTAEGIAGVALELLSRKIVLPKTVTMIAPGDFTGPNGGTITVRVPQPSASRTQASPGSALTADDVSEIPVNVSLGHVYHLKNITDQEMSYSIEDYARQVTLPQTEAVAAGCEAVLAAVMNGLAVEGNTYTFDTSAPSPDEETVTRNVLLAARKFLSDNDAPHTDRWLACGTTIYNRIIKLLNPTTIAFDNAVAGDALREAMVGRIYGFNVFESPSLDATEAVAYHKSAFVMAVKAPVNPRGATMSAATSGQGLALRQVFQYDATSASDQSLISTFVGAAAVYEDGTGANGTDNQRFVKLAEGAVA